MSHVTACCIEEDLPAKEVLAGYLEDLPAKEVLAGYLEDLPAKEVLAGYLEDTPAKEVLATHSTCQCRGNVNLPMPWQCSWQLQLAVSDFVADCNWAHAADKQLQQRLTVTVLATTAADQKSHAQQDWPLLERSISPWLVSMSQPG